MCEDLNAVLGIFRVSETEKERGNGGFASEQRRG